MKKVLLLPLLLMIVFGCSQKANKNEMQTDHSIKTNKYAKGFEIIEQKDGTAQIRVYNPWQTDNTAVYSYTFTRTKAQKDAIQIPLQKVMCLSTTHVAFLEKLNVHTSIIGISNPQYIYSEKVQKKIKTGKIVNIGYDQSLNYELIIDEDPDLVFIYGVGGENAQFYSKLEELGIKTMFIGEYLEQDPLAKFEWIKLFGYLFNASDKADSLFISVENEYRELLHILPIAEQNKKELRRPKVIFNLPWKGTWYVPGGKSYLAQMVETCHGDYIWKNNESRSTIPLNIETVLTEGNEADIWLNPGNAKTKSQILQEDERLQYFKPFIYGNIYSFNRRINKAGGNDYWESGVVNPHLILKDMIAILHPKLIPDHKFYYYRKIE